MCAWYIVRVNSRISRAFYYLCVVSMVVPFQMVMYTLPKTADELGLNNPIGIVLVYLGFGAGLAVFMFTGFMKSIPLEIEEAATIDGANKLQRMWHVDIPTIMPTFVMLTIMSFGKILNVGYEKVYLLQNDLNIGVSEIISTYVYKQGLISSQFGYSAAVSLFNNVVGLLLVLTVNKIAKKTADMSLF